MTSWISYLLASPYSLKKSISVEPFLRCCCWCWSACIAPRPPPPQRSSAREAIRICPGAAPHTTPARLPARTQGGGRSASLDRKQGKARQAERTLARSVARPLLRD
uniref:Uncharacterized protein n=1 Tax=Arundo donax TaxID=35708 RepID=A0A0A9E674_ARUDO